MLKRIFWFLLACSFYVTSYATDRFIIKYKPDAQQESGLAKGGMAAKVARKQMMQPIAKASLSKILYDTGVKVTEVHAVATGAHVLITGQDLNAVQTQEFIQSVQHESNVEYIEEDRLLKPISMTGNLVDVNPNWQWDLDYDNDFSIQSSWNGDNFYKAWKLLESAGYGIGSNVTIAVVDTGYTPHPNFLSGLQQLGNTSGVYGYQFISDCRISGDCLVSTPSNLAANYPYKANGRDLGDYVSFADIDNSNGFFSEGCYQTSSTWHGSHVTGSIVAGGNSLDFPDYMAGGAYSAHVIPVRVLGKCGGYVSDIANGIMWASGLDVSYNGSLIPRNPNPAQLVNLSLGGSGTCNKTEQDTINAVTQNGTLIVVAAGNDSDDIKKYNPSGCQGVIVVAAKGPTNRLTYYSNYGATTIAASGGDSSITGCQIVDGLKTCPSMIYSTVWSSATKYKDSTKGGYPSFAFYSGTSMATPHVVAAVADMISVLKARGETYTLYGIMAILQQTAKEYNNCSVYGCTTSGALDVEAAINYILQNGAVPVAPPAPAPLVSTSGSSGGGGGGCSAVSDGNDFSLILLLLIGSACYAYRRRKNRERMVK